MLPIQFELSDVNDLALLTFKNIYAIRRSLGTFVDFHTPSSCA